MSETEKSSTSSGTTTERTGGDTHAQRTMREDSRHATRLRSLLGTVFDGFGQGTSQYGGSGPTPAPIPSHWLKNADSNDSSVTSTTVATATDQQEEKKE